MVCKDAQAVMHDLLDQTNSQPDEEFMEHMQICPACDRHMQMLTHTIGAVRGLEWLEAPQSITWNVMRQISHNFGNRRSWMFRWHMREGIVIAACICLAFIGGVWWAEPGQFSVLDAAPDARLSIVHNQVIIPTGMVYRGNLTISNGDVIVHGKVDGNVTALNGHVILASGAAIRGHTEEIHAFWQTTQYYFGKMWDTIVRWFR
ncbi:hypothetical protein LSG31_06780 [Fodinisporobacter ferrooxydans]|uniref:Anti-sigma factor n=1 Tax=Fodinisporobacter ferrooxydans TaxID=2901836 RepID=A0ABY4CPQ1_9BACL|nr:hypothetical protein LSG31_06780 [Alicyclobacillaceae bacterium MYW30-H2]